ncbi:MAG TPA: hypothetical protein VGP77_16170 [Vicinamibacterales bacterium]|jgi:hypothetical protein|nr:hypothetical protein [Vicinamibacterales bacterium]
MAVGDALHRIGRNLCSCDLCGRVLEPVIADLQHEYEHADGAAERFFALLGGYAAFWRSFGWCLARDAAARESRRYLGSASVAFLIVVGTLALSEILFLHTLQGVRNVVLRVLSWVPYLSYIGWSARINTATLTFGLPLAMLPALLYATRRRGIITPSAALLAIALGTILTTASSGWIAPAVVRWSVVAERDRFVVAIGGRRQVPPIDFDGCPDCRAWPDVIRGARAPLKHRYPGYPTYVAPEDRGLPAWYRSVLRERLLLIVFAILAGLIGWRLGLALERRQADDDGVFRTRDDGGRRVVVVGEDGED